jgi:hypothetical protein
MYTKAGTFLLQIIALKMIFNPSGVVKEIYE